MSVFNLLLTFVLFPSNFVFYSKYLRVVILSLFFLKKFASLFSKAKLFTSSL